MSTFWTLTRNLLDELTTQIQALAPNTATECPFIVRPIEDTETSSFSENVFTNRMFEFGIPDIDPAGSGIEQYIGTADRNPRVLIPLVVAYNIPYMHREAIDDDADKLIAWLDNNRTSVADIHIRFIEKRPDVVRRSSNYLWADANYVVTADLRVTDL